ncbi:DUF397 domain-containing protein [Streptomyces sp. NPDC004539]|uniref:DUF397 domain-containing protein n=1 Tax=Streptomyces sp. NPDC004539 TaxID=3154280 RepID=UPI0033BCD8C8
MTLTWRKSSYSENGGQCVEISSPTWRTSSYSNNGGQCVQIGTWHKSSHSNNGGACLEASLSPTTPTTILIRDSKTLPNAPTLTLPAPAFTAFLNSLT